MSAAKASVDREALDKIRALYEHAKAHEWVEGFDHNHNESYVGCPSCRTYVRQNFRGDDLTTREHAVWCDLAATLAFMETWLRVEEDLLRKHEEEDE